MDQSSGERGHHSHENFVPGTLGEELTRKNIGSTLNEMIRAGLEDGTYAESEDTTIEDLKKFTTSFQSLVFLKLPSYSFPLDPLSLL